MNDDSLHSEKSLLQGLTTLRSVERDADVSRLRFISAFGGIEARTPVQVITVRGATEDEIRNLEGLAAKRLMFVSGDIRDDGLDLWEDCADEPIRVSGSVTYGREEYGCDDLRRLATYYSEQLDEQREEGRKLVKAIEDAMKFVEREQGRIAAKQRLTRASVDSSAKIQLLSRIRECLDRSGVKPS